MFERIRNRLHDTRALGTLMTTAEKEARRMGDGPPGAEHFLLAAPAHPDGAARRVLDRLGVDASVLGAAIEAQHAAALAPLGLFPEANASATVATSDAPLPTPPPYDARESGRALLRHMADMQGGAPFSSARVLDAVAASEHGVAVRTLRALGVERGALRAAVATECRCGE